MTDSRGRMGTKAEVLFGANAMVSIAEAAERSQAHGGLRGGWDTDANGSFARVEGAGVPEVGMYFPSEGTEPSDAMCDILRSAIGEGVMVVIDPYAGELAVYIVDDDGCRTASALVSE